MTVLKVSAVVIALDVMVVWTVADIIALVIVSDVIVSSIVSHIIGLARQHLDLFLFAQLQVGVYPWREENMSDEWFTVCSL